MNQKIKINTRKLLLEKLGVRSDLLSVAQKLYLNIILMMLEKDRFLNEPGNIGDLYVIRFFKDLDTPLRISDEYSIKKISVIFELTKLNEKNYNPNEKLVYMGMGVNTGTRVERGNEKNPLVFPKNTPKELKLSLRLGTFDDIEDITKQSFLKDFKPLKREFLSTLAHELKHVYDASIRSTNMEDKLNYVATTNTFRESEFRSIALLFYYAYKAHYFETAVYQTEMAKNIEVGGITKKEFAEFLKETQIYKDATEMENFSYSDVVDPLFKVIEDTYNEFFPSGYASLMSRLQGDMTGISPDSEYNFVALGKSMDIDMDRLSKDEYINILTELFRKSNHEDLAFMLVLGTFKIAVRNYHGFATIFIEEFVKDRVSKSSNSRTRDLRKQLFQHRDDLVNKVIKEFTLDEGTEGLKKAIRSMVAEINQAGRDMKKKFGKLYAYDELFVDGDQPTKRTTRLPG